MRPPLPLHPLSFTYAAFLTAEHTHITDLFLVSGESWLLSRKISDALSSLPRRPFFGTGSTLKPIA